MGRVLANAEAAAGTQICMAAMSISIKPPPAPNAGYGSSSGRQRELHSVTGGQWLFAAAEYLHLRMRRGSAPVSRIATSSVACGPGSAQLLDADRLGL